MGNRPEEGRDTDPEGNDRPGRDEEEVVPASSGRGDLQEAGQHDGNDRLFDSSQGIQQKSHFNSRILPEETPGY